MRSGHIAECVNHRHHHEAKRQRDADMCHRASGYVVDHNRAGAGENERKRADEFRGELSHALIATQCSTQNASILARI